MASDVNELQKALDLIKKIASAEYLGASDRRRALVNISDACVNGMNAAIKSGENSNVNNG